MKAATRYLVVLFTLVASTLGAASAYAISLEFNPVAQTKTLGQTALVDVVVKNPGSTVVGSYDFFVNFDTSILQLTSVTPGTALGSADYLSFGDYTADASAGNVNVWEVSLVSQLAPNYQNGSDFTLFTLAFLTTSTGVSPLSFTGNIGSDPLQFLGDGNGYTIDGVAAGRGSITVVANDASSVPEPGTLLLLAPGLAGLAIWRRRRN